MGFRNNGICFHVLKNMNIYNIIYIYGAGGVVGFDLGFLFAMELHSMITACP